MPAAQIHDFRNDLADRGTRRVTELDVRELVAAARRDDPRAWAELMRRYGGLVRSVVRRYRLQDADAADAVQSTWCTAFEQLATVRDPERLGAWLSTTAGRECLAVLRKARRERPDETAVAARLTTVGGPESAVLDAEVAGAVRAAVDQLEPRRRRLVQELFYLPPRDYTQVAQSMDIPIGSIGPTRGRALRRLRATLEQAGFGAQPAGGHETGHALPA